MRSYLRVVGDVRGLVAAMALWLVAPPSPALSVPPTGKRVLDFVLEADSGRVALGTLDERLPTVVLTATRAEAGGGILIAPRLGISRAPTRWQLRIEHTNRRGVAVGRELPVVGEGLPPLAIWVADPPPALHLRATLELELGRFDGTTSAPIWVPLLPEAIPPVAEQRTLSIDGRTARLGAGRQVLTLELDAPATVTLRVDDGRGSRWLRRGVSMTEVRWPGTELRAPARMDLVRRQLHLGTRVVELPSTARVLRAAGDVGAAWVELELPAERATAWRATWGAGEAIVAERFGVGRPPTRVSARPELAAEWVELELSTSAGWWVTTGRWGVSGTGPSAALDARLLEARAGELLVVGTATAARAYLAP